MFANAEVVLAPWAPAVLEYQAPAHTSTAGELGPPGTVSVRGRRTYVYLGCLGLMLVAVLLVFALAIVAAIST